MNLFVNGYDVYVTNDRHSFHLPMSQVVTGGQRTSRWRRLYWSVRYTRYFFAKYYSAYAQKQGSHGTPLARFDGLCGIRALSGNAAAAAVCRGQSGAAAKATTCEDPASVSR